MNNPSSFSSISRTKKALADLEERRKPNPIIDIDTGLQVMDIEAYEYRLRKRLEND